MKTAPSVVSSAPETVVAGTISGTTYTARSGAFRVSVPAAFSQGPSRERVAGDSPALSPPRVHDDLRVEDGSELVEDARVDYVIFGPSSAHADETYHVVVANPDPRHRYDALAKYADAVITGYLQQYDDRHPGVATELIRRPVDVAGREGVYAAYRYEYRGRDDVTMRFYASFCVFQERGHRLVTTLIERRPRAVSETTDPWDSTLERRHREQGCTDAWHASLELDAPAPSSLAYY